MSAGWAGAAIIGGVVLAALGLVYWLLGRVVAKELDGYRDPF